MNRVATGAHLPIFWRFWNDRADYTARQNTNKESTPYRPELPAQHPIIWCTAAEFFSVGAAEKSHRCCWCCRHPSFRVRPRETACPVVVRPSFNKRRHRQRIAVTACSRYADPRKEITAPIERHVQFISIKGSWRKIFRRLILNEYLSFRRPRSNAKSLFCLERYLSCRHDF